MIKFPKDIVKEIEDLFLQYIWKGNSHKLKKEVIIQSYENGGCSMVDLESVIKAEQIKWIQSVLQGIEGSWNDTMREAIGEKNLNFLLRSNYNPQKLPKCTLFYKSCLS